MTSIEFNFQVSHSRFFSFFRYFRLIRVFSVNFNHWNFPDGGVNPKRGRQPIILAIVFPKTAWNWKKCVGAQSWIRQCFVANCVTARKGSLGHGNIFIGVCQEFCSQGGSTWAGTPPRDQVHPQTRYTPPLDQVHPPGTVTPPGTRFTPQRRACWQIRSMRGRYGSYWNAILSIYFLNLEI